MGVDHKNLVHEIFVACAHSCTPTPAALLHPVGAQRHPLDVAGVADRKDHILALDEIFVGLRDLGFDDFRTPRRRKLVTHIFELIADHPVEAGPAPQDIQVVDNLHGKIFKLAIDFASADRGQPLQTEFENSARLGLA